MNQLSYYRDLIASIVSENTDDIPMPPSRRQIQLNKFYRAVGSRKLNKVVWLAFSHYSPGSVVKDIWLGETVEAAAYKKNNRWVFSSRMTLTWEAEFNIDPESDDTYQRLAATKIARTLRKHCVEIFQVLDSFTVSEWIGGSLVEVRAPKFAEFLTQEMSGLEYLTDDFNSADIGTILTNWIVKGRKTRV